MYCVPSRQAKSESVKLLHSLLPSAPEANYDGILRAVCIRYVAENGALRGDTVVSLKVLFVVLTARKFNSFEISYLQLFSIFNYFRSADERLDYLMFRSGLVKQAFLNIRLPCNNDYRLETC